MRRLVTHAWIALLVVFMAVSVVVAAAEDRTEDRENPNVERLRHESADVRAAAAQALGGG